MDFGRGALLTDLYQLSMTQAYLEYGKLDTAVFEFFFRRLPPERGFLIAAGLEQAIDFLEQFSFSGEEIEWLIDTGRFSSQLIDYLAALRFTGDVDAVPEGTAVFADEPILRITAPLPQAQLVETRLINLLHYQTLIASKAARMVLIAPGKTLIDFGLRRAHGAEAGVMAARASYIGGFSGTATTIAGKLFGIPVSGTMAHSFVEAFESEAEAFASFAYSRPEQLTLLIDTYDVEVAARKVIALASGLRERGTEISAVRIDSGDLIELSRHVRNILDEGGLSQVAVFVSGGIDEDSLRHMIDSGAPISGFGIGTSLTTSSDVPALDCAYKLQEYAGLARRKLSPGKATWPGRKQIWRQYGPDDRIIEDALSIEDDQQRGEPLVRPVMRAGAHLSSLATLSEIRDHAARQLARLPEPLRRLDSGVSCEVHVSNALRRLASEVDQRISAQPE